jgi:hypothetical protein
MRLPRAGEAVQKKIISKLAGGGAATAEVSGRRGAVTIGQKGIDSRQTLNEKRDWRSAWACYDGEVDGRSSCEP